MHLLSPESAQRLRSFAHQGESWIYPATDGEVRLICASLPGRHVLGAARLGDLLWIVVDPDKPDAHQHLSDLIDNWPLDASLEQVLASLPRPATSILHIESCGEAS